MSRFLPAFVLAILLALAGSAMAIAQTATPTPVPAPTPDAAGYEGAALEQLGNLRNIAADLYDLTGIPTSTIASHADLLAGDVASFAGNVTPPAEFAPFHMRVFMALRPCMAAARVVSAQGSDVFWVMVAASYTQACYAAVSEASVEWARVTGKVPIFQATPTPAGSTTEVPAVEAAPAGEQGVSSQTVDSVTVEILGLEVQDFESYREVDSETADRLVYDSDFTPAAAAILSLNVANHTDKSVQLLPVQSGAVVVAGEQFDLFAYRLLDIGDLDTTYHPGAFKTGKIVFALPQSAWDAIVDGASVAYYIDSSRDYAFEIEPSLP